MKKIINILIVLLLTMLFIPNVYASNNVKIESITLDKKTEGVLEINSPKYDVMDITFDISFLNVGDYAKYKVVLKNYSNRDYYIDKDKTTQGEYTSYKYEFENNETIIKANKELIMYITIKYEKPVPQSKLVNGVFTGESQSKINLSDVVLSNPNTYSSVILLFLLLIILIVITVLKVNKKKKIGLNLLLIGLLLIPITTYALEKITITTTTKITVEKSRNIIESRYKNGNTNDERGFWLDSDNITEITFENKIVLPDNNEYVYDLSEAKDNSIIAYYEYNDYPMIHLHIMSDGYIYANQDSSHMFENFYNLKKINNLKYLKTNYVEDMSYMFHYLPTIEEIDISSFNTRNVTKMNNMFQELDYRGNIFVDRINVSGIDTSNVTNMSYMFEGYNGEILDVSSFDTSKVTTMERMFSNARNLDNLDLDSFDTRNVTTMEGMFVGASGLTSIDLSSFDTSNVTNMKDMFQGYTGEELDVSSLETSKVTTMSAMFAYLQNVTNLDLSNLDTSNVTDMSLMFKASSSLSSINLNSFDTSNVTNFEGMFGDCNSIKSLDLRMFDTGNATNMKEMFWGMNGIESIDLSSFDTSNVTDFQEMFYHSDIIKILDLSSFDTRNATRLSGMFSFCSNLENIYVSNKWDLSHLNANQSMFYSANKLPNFDPNDVTSAKANTSSTGYLTLKS